MIVEFVREHGCKWRLIASMLEGRSDDAVRNRWNRVKDLPVHNGGRKPDSEQIMGGAKEHIGATSAGTEAGPMIPVANDDKPERVSWSRLEDEVILRSVVDLGHKWNKIATRLPGRTGHAIRNRFSRLQGLVNRGHPVAISSGYGAPIGIQLIPQQIGREALRCNSLPFAPPS